MKTAKIKMKPTESEYSIRTTIVVLWSLELSLFDFILSRLRLMARKVIQGADKIHLVGYGFAGIDLRLAICQDEALASKVSTLLTVNSPNR